MLWRGFIRAIAFWGMYTKNVDTEVRCKKIKIKRCLQMSNQKYSEKVK